MGVLQQQGVLHRCRAADPAAVRAIVVALFDTLDHHYRGVVGQCELAESQPLGQLELRQDLVALSVAIALRAVLHRPGGQHDRAMPDPLAFTSCTRNDGGREIAHVSVDLGDA